MTDSTDLSGRPPSADVWPPRDVDPQSDRPSQAPWLNGPFPPVLELGPGRQLFVDDYLLAENGLTRRFHAAEGSGEPVLWPQTAVEMNEGRCPAAAPFKDGVWYDPADQFFKLYYQAGWMQGVALALSRDGRIWERPALDVVPGTNLVLPLRPDHYRDGVTVWLDHFAARADERWKMFQYVRHIPDSVRAEWGELYLSADGIHWRPAGRTSPCGDNTSFFYNPFRRKWVFSVRRGWPMRARNYYEHAEFPAAGQWTDKADAPWLRADRLDGVDPLTDHAPQLYDLNCAAYESLLLGAVNIFYGPENHLCAKTGEPKLIDLQLAFSRDGFHWDRTNRQAFIPCSRRRGTWNYGYIHAAGGLCLTVGDRLYFYYGAFSGEAPAYRGRTELPPEAHLNPMYAGSSTGLATLRRDGFASLDAGISPAAAVTKPLRLKAPHLFVNADAARGSLRVEVLDQECRPLPGFGVTDCLPLREDATKREIRWRERGSLGELLDRPIRLKFHLQQGSLFAFWFAATPAGHSGGYVAAGGPEFTGALDA